MKQIFAIISIFVVLPLLSTGQQWWEITISNNNFNYSSIRFDKSYDEGIVISSRADLNKSLMIKTDINGAVLWEKTFINNNTFIVHRIKQNDVG